MIRTFLLAVDVGTSMDFLGIAEDISSDLIRAGHDVQSVKPWKSTADAAPTLLPPPLQQTPPPTQPFSPPNL